MTQDVHETRVARVLYSSSPLRHLPTGPSDRFQRYRERVVCRPCSQCRKLGRSTSKDVHGVLSCLKMHLQTCVFDLNGDLCVSLGDLKIPFPLFPQSVSGRGGYRRISDHRFGPSGSPPRESYPSHLSHTLRKLTESCSRDVGSVGPNFGPRR